MYDNGVGAAHHLQLVKPPAQVRLAHGKMVLPGAFEQFDCERAEEKRIQCDSHVLRRLLRRLNCTCRDVPDEQRTGGLIDVVASLIKLFTSIDRTRGRSDVVTLPSAESTK